MERQFMAEGGIDSDEFLKFASEESRNVSADGNFSIQVHPGLPINENWISGIRICATPR